MRSGLSAGFSGVASFSATLAAATLMAGRATTFVSGFAATLIVVLAGALSVVLTASFGAAPRPILATFFTDGAGFRDASALVLRASLPFVCFEDIIPSDFQGIFPGTPRYLT